ncbi:hypothetical protein ACFWQC_00805 [Nocardioides sp. NPDC058538]|uniref:hypothetical protein n=1 Tax=Nocardioides sp. NPDC058538 TaxID=3346542 RepID=UPI0036531430
MGRRTSLGVLVVLLAVAGWAVSLWLPDDAPATRRTPPAATAAPAPGPVDGLESRRDLAALATGARRPEGLTVYVRSSFGGSWADTDGNGCNQRDDVLLRDAVEVRKEFQCAYAARWIGTKTRWSLAADDSERRALEEMLGYC